MVVLLVVVVLVLNCIVFSCSSTGRDVYFIVKHDENESKNQNDDEGGKENACQSKIDHVDDDDLGDGMALVMETIQQLNFKDEILLLSTATSNSGQEIQCFAK